VVNCDPETTTHCEEASTEKLQAHILTKQDNAQREYSQATSTPPPTTTTVDTNGSNQCNPILIADQTVANVAPATLLAADGTSNKNRETPPDGKKRAHVLAKQDDEQVRNMCFDKAGAVTKTKSQIWTEPREVDVLMGRNHGNGRAANTIYRELVAQNVDAYRLLSVQDSAGKDRIAWFVMHSTLQRGGRFLQANKQLQWAVAEEAIVLETIRRALGRKITKADVEKNILKKTQGKALVNLCNTKGDDQGKQTCAVAAATIKTNEPSQRVALEVDQMMESASLCQQSRPLDSHKCSNKNRQTTCGEKDPEGEKQAHVLAKEVAEHGEKPQIATDKQQVDRTTAKMNEPFHSEAFLVDRADGKSNSLPLDHDDYKSGHKKIGARVINKHDVISKGGRSHHVGNDEFLEYVRERKQDYKNAVNKSMILQAIQELVTNSEGQFLNKNKEGGWALKNQEQITARIQACMLRVIKTDLYCANEEATQRLHVDRKVQSCKSDRESASNRNPPIVAVPVLQVRNTHVYRAGASTKTKSRSFLQPREVDVIIGRLQGHDRAANIIYKELIARNLDSYRLASRSDFAEKDRIARLVLNSILQRGGRFLQKNARMQWVVIDHATMVEKIKQSFRDQKSKVDVDDKLSNDTHVKAPVNACSGSTSESISAKKGGRELRVRKNEKV
jgi:hypothetical protein